MQNRISHSGPKNSKKSRQKNHEINQKNFVKLQYWHFNLFHGSKIDFWPFLKLQKMDLGQFFFAKLHFWQFETFSQFKN